MAVSLNAKDAASDERPSVVVLYVCENNELVFVKNLIQNEEENRKLRMRLAEQCVTMRFGNVVGVSLSCTSRCRVFEVFGIALYERRCVLPRARCLFRTFLLIPFLFSADSHHGGTGRLKCCSCFSVFRSVWCAHLSTFLRSAK